MHRVVLAAAFVFASCGGATVLEDDEVKLATYERVADGISISHPTHWRRSSKPLAGAATPTVELVALTSAEPATPVKACSPLPWATAKALAPGDFVLVLSVMDGPEANPEQSLSTDASRPTSLLEIPEARPQDLAGGCTLEDVRQRRKQFVENGTVYSVYLAVRGELAPQDEQSLENSWASLELSPIPQPDGDAKPDREYWHVLPTHCGVHATEFAGSRWIVEGETPEGLAGPGDPGHVVLRDNYLTFTSRLSGVTVRFRPATPVDPPDAACG